MRLATVCADGQRLYGLIKEGGFANLGAVFPQWPTLLDVIEADGLAELFQAAKDVSVSHVNGTFSYDLPLPNARRILCVGVNFPDRNAEYRDGSAQPEHMSLFPRFISGFTAHEHNLVRPPETHALDYEGELAIVIGKTGRRITQEAAYSHIAALTICNEGTLRDWVRHAKFNVTQGKNWDRSGAMGPWLVPFTEARQIDEARIQTRVNGELRQDDVLSNMIFPIREEIAYISTFMTLQPGDIIVTGTPTGAGARFDPPRYLVPGDIIEIEVEGIGLLRNGVEDET